MSLLTFGRKSAGDDVDVPSQITAINRLLESKYPDCTCCVVQAGNRGMATQWVTVELEITRESLDCLDWYTKQATARQLVLSKWKARHTNALESDLTTAFLSSEGA